MVSGRFAPALDVLAPQFEQLTGIGVVSALGAPESISTRLTGGEAADVIVITRPLLDQLADMGEVRPASRVDLGRSSIGAAVRSGATKPDIGTTEALIGALLTAESIGYSASVSGTYLSTVVFPQLGIWERIRSKSRRIEGEYVGNAVARGEVELGLQQVSEILAVEGVDYVGPIPNELQSSITYSAGITERTINIENALRLVEFLSSDAAAAAIAATGHASGAEVSLMSADGVAH